MYRRLAWATVVLAALGGGVLVLQAFQAGSASDKCSIEGRVLDSLTGKPIARASAALHGPANPARRSAGTDTDGHFAFRDLPPGSYWIEVGGAGYARLSGSIGVSLPLDLQPGEQVKDLALRLMPSGALAGRVLDEAGKPMQGAQVILLRRSYQRAESEWISTYPKTTNGLGEFRFDGLWAGLHLLTVAPGSRPAETEKGGASSPGGQPETSYVPTFYPGSVDAGSATPIQVRAGLETKLADLRMRKVNTVRVSGRVKAPYQRLLPNVRLTPAGASLPWTDSRLGFGAPVDQADGSFDIRGVPPGDYVLTAWSLMWCAASPFHAGGKDLEVADVQPASGPGLSGTVAFDDGRPVWLDGASVRLYPSLLPDTMAIPARIGVDGRFKVPGVFSHRYRLGFEKLPEGFYVKSVRLGDREVTGDWLDFTDGVPRDPLQITLSAAAARIEGAAQTTDNTPAGGATVVLVPDSRRSSLYRRTRAGADGSFYFRSVPPGEYSLVAVEDLEPDAHLASNFLARFGSRTERISLLENGRTNVSLKVVPYKD